MCGIHGFIDKKLTANEIEPLIQRMVHSTSHRGPDASHHICFNYAALGHNRLSIIDLSEGGRQPLTIGSHTIVFNGEIYNYKEIRTELQGQGITFHSDSDTEVLLKSFIHYGEQAFTRFFGMWACAIWDESTEKLVCSRDRFGI